MLAEYQDMLSNAILSIIYLLLSYIIANIFSKKLEQILKKILNLRMIKSHIKGEGSLNKIIEFIALFTKYFIYFIGLIFALNQLKIELVSRVIYNLLDYTPNIIVAGIFITLGIMLANLVKRIIKISLASTGIDELFSDLKPKLLPSNFAAMIVQYIIIIISIVIALAQLGLQTQLLSWIALSVITILTLFLFGIAYSMLKPNLQDLVAGIVIRNKHYLRTGEYIYINDEEYRVRGIGVLHTKLEKDGYFMVMKNSEILTKFKRKL